MNNKFLAANPQVSLSGLSYKDIYDLNAAAVAAGVGNKLLKTDMYDKVYKTHAEDYKKSLMYLLDELGSTNTTTAEWVGHHEQAQLQLNFFIQSALVGSGAGAAKAWTIASGSHFNGKSMPMVGDEIEVKGTGIFLQVVGKDTGSNNVKLGVDASGAVFVPGALGGTASANVIVVKPKIATQTVPAVGGTTPIIIHTTTVGVGSCPVDGYIHDTTEYRYGFSQVRSDLGFHRNMVWKEVECSYANIFKGKTFVSDTFAKNEIDHYRKVAHKIIFTPSATNTGLTVNGDERDNSNSIISQIVNNGGYTHTYSTWAFSDFKTIVRKLTLNGGTTSYMILGGYDLIAAIQDDLRANGAKPIELSQIVVAGKKFCVNVDFECITYNGIKFYFKVWDIFSSEVGAGVQYSNDAIVFPLDDIEALTLDRKSDTRKKLQVWFEKGSNGQEYTHENFFISDQTKSSGCDKGSWHALTHLSVELSAVNQFVYIKKS